MLTKKQIIVSMVIFVTMSMTLSVPIGFACMAIYDITGMIANKHKGIIKV